MGSAFCLPLPSFPASDARVQKFEACVRLRELWQVWNYCRAAARADAPPPGYLKNCAAMLRAQSARYAERATADEASAENIRPAVASMPPVTKIGVGLTRR